MQDILYGRETGVRGRDLQDSDGI